MNLPLPSSVRVMPRVSLVARDAQLWRIQLAGGTQGILRRHDPGALHPGDPGALADLRWQHGFLTELAATGFAAPSPLPVLDGDTVLVHQGAVWEALSFLEGEVIGWESEPPLEGVGAFMATYHQAAAVCSSREQRPSALPLVHLAATLNASGVSEAPKWLADMCEELRKRLVACPSGERLVIHGDFTTHNVLAAGSPPAPAGLIDFTLAHVEDAVADLAYGLWRSGRPHQDAEWLDISRVSALVRGYCRVRSLPEHRAALLPLFLWGRGVQRMVKAGLRGQISADPPGQLVWVRTNESRLAEAVVAAADEAGR